MDHYLQIVHASKTMGLMVGCILTCYLPLIIKWHLCGKGLNSPVYSIVSQVQNFLKIYKYYQWFQALVAANSFMNPIIYALKIPAFRTTLLAYSKNLEDPGSHVTIGGRKSSMASKVLSNAAGYVIEVALKLS